MQIAGHNFCFLLVEDDADSRTILEVVLTSLGHRVVACVDGLQALAVAGAVPFDAIILDLQLPGADGVATARALRALPSTAHVPIMCLTARVEPAARAASLAAGCNRVLYKPATPERVLATLAEILREAGRLAPGEELE